MQGPGEAYKHHTGIRWSPSPSKIAQAHLLDALLLVQALCPPTWTPRMDLTPLQHRPRSRPREQDCRLWLHPDHTPPMIYSPWPVSARPQSQLQADNSVRSGCWIPWSSHRFCLRPPTVTPLHRPSCLCVREKRRAHKLCLRFQSGRLSPALPSVF
ncbi:hypothetical protein FKM82_006323 [Ascaphus truei]